MFKNEDTVYIIKTLDNNDSYYQETTNKDWSLCDNLMDAKYFKSRQEAIQQVANTSFTEFHKFEIIKIKYEFYWTYVEE